MTSDVEALGESLAGHALSLVADLLKTVAFLGMMFWLSWEATLVLLAMLPVLAFAMQFFQRRVRFPPSCGRARRCRRRPAICRSAWPA